MIWWGRNGRVWVRRSAHMRIEDRFEWKDREYGYLDVMLVYFDVRDVYLLENDALQDRAKHDADRCRSIGSIMCFLRDNL
jgi:hypothetical protein